MSRILLGVNIDHVATIRNARGTKYPDPIHAAFLAEQAGADGITIHLREDRRHITDRDVRLLKEVLHVKMNLEMAATNEMMDVACEIKPSSCCLVPENRNEITTEGGLDVIENYSKIKKFVKILNQEGIVVSIFIDPEIKQIDKVVSIGAPFIEVHTGKYADAKNHFEKIVELNRIKIAIKYATSKNLKVNAGHGLTYQNVSSIAQFPEIYELNIGHSIIGRALFSGMKSAVSEMKQIIFKSRSF